MSGGKSIGKLKVQLRSQGFFYFWDRFAPHLAARWVGPYSTLADAYFAGKNFWRA